MCVYPCIAMYVHESNNRVCCCCMVKTSFAVQCVACALRCSSNELGSDELNWIRSRFGLHSGVFLLLDCTQL